MEVQTSGAWSRNRAEYRASSLREFGGCRSQMKTFESVKITSHHIPLPAY